METNTENKSKVILIAAVAFDGTIGNQGEIPWHLPTDLKFFKEKTMGHSVIMGRRTFESIGKPLKNRLNIVVSSAKERLPSPTVIVKTIPAAFKAAKVFGQRDIYIIGGEQIYRQTIDLADELYITHISKEFNGDTKFPPIPDRFIGFTEMYFEESGLECQIVKYMKRRT